MAAVAPIGYQVILHTQECNIWQMNAPSLAVDGEPSDKTYTLQTTGQKCRFYTRPSVSAPQIFGRMEEDNIFTLDMVRFPAGVIVDDGYVLKFTSAGDIQNSFWEVMGEATSRSLLQFRQVYVRRLPAAPYGVS